MSIAPVSVPPELTDEFCNSVRAITITEMRPDGSQHAMSWLVSAAVAEDMTQTLEAALRMFYDPTALLGKQEALLPGEVVLRLALELLPYMVTL